MPPLGPGAAAFLTLVLASVSFDGLHDTFRWLAFIGINPLEFPGRSAVQGANTLGLLAAWAATAAAILGTIALGRRIAGRRTAFWREAGPVLLSFLPIAAGYHAAHYLVALLTGARYTVAAARRPARPRLRSLLGLPEHWVSLGFLADAARGPGDLERPVRADPRRPPARRPAQPPPRAARPGARPGADDGADGALHRLRPLAALRRHRRLSGTAR